MIDATIVAQSLLGEPLRTIRDARENVILEVIGGRILVSTSRSPAGQPVPVADLQAALDTLGAGEEVVIDPDHIGHRSSFLGAVLLTLPMVEVTPSSPPVASVAGGIAPSPDVLADLETRLRMWADLKVAGGPSGMTASVVRDLRVFYGGRGIWTDTDRTRGIGGYRAVAVGALHTGRDYVDDLSDDAVLYHYPVTKSPGRDVAEVDAMKAAGDLRLPIFVVLQERSMRTVRQGWVTNWDDATSMFLVEFGPLPRDIPRGDDVDTEPFEVFEDREDVFRRTRGRPNQQRFKLQVLQRYAGICAMCACAIPELIDAAHLVPNADRGTSDPRNGLPICKNHHSAMDKALVVFDEQGRLHVRGYTASELQVRLFSSA